MHNSHCEPCNQTTRLRLLASGACFQAPETLDQFWANVRDGIDSTSDVPPGRWLIEPERAFDPRVAVADRVYSIRGGFVDAADARRARA